jgi:hypothetical protein
VPGRTPAEAVTAFVEPLQAALGCLAIGARISCKPSRSPKLGSDAKWIINAGGGLSLRSVAGDRDLVFHASMEWKVIPDTGPKGPCRVTTLGYKYSLDDGGAELWAMHWHPRGSSPVHEPHMHLGSAMATAGRLIDGAHLPVPRQSFEDAVRWCVTFGAKPVRDDWEEQLRLAEQPHLLHRSWDKTSPIV